MLYFVLVAECPHLITFWEGDVSLISLKLLVFKELIYTKQAHLKTFSLFRAYVQCEYMLKLSLCDYSFFSFFLGHSSMFGGRARGGLVGCK